MTVGWGDNSACKGKKEKRRTLRRMLGWNIVVELYFFNILQATGVFENIPEI